MLHLSFSSLVDTIQVQIYEDARTRAVAAAGPEQRAPRPGQGPPAGSPRPVRVVIDLTLPRLGAVELAVTLRGVVEQALPAKGPCGPELDVVVVDERRRLDSPRRPEEDRLGPGGQCGRQGPDEPAGWDTLTATELHVALLAAAGLTNRQISEQLFTSPRTTESHLARVYRKLRISGRTQLAAEATRRPG